MNNIFFNKKDLKFLGKNVIIGRTVRIRHPEECIIEDNVIIDDFTYISARYLHIKNNCHIASNSVISGGSEGLFMDEYSTFGSHCSIHCSSSDYDKLSMDLPSVKEEYRFGGTSLPIYIGKYNTIGAHSCILPGVKLPDGFSCGSFSLLRNDIEYIPYSLYVGVPVHFLKKRENVNEFLKKMKKIKDERK